MNFERTFHVSTRRAFSLGELLLAVVFVGLLLAPLLAYVSGIGGLGSLVGEHGRGRSWVSVQNRAVAAGFDSSRLAYLDFSQNPLMPARDRLPVVLEAGVGESGLVSVGVIRTTGQGGRPAAKGLVLSPGSSLPDVEVPDQPLASRFMQPPLVIPKPGSRLVVDQLAADGSLEVVVDSLEGGRVHVSFEMQAGDVSGLSKVNGKMGLAQLVAGRRGQAWVEYAGDFVAGARRLTLSDGRAQWLVPEGGRLRLVEPSEKVNFSYGLDLGAPVLRVQGNEYKAAEVVTVDYRQLLEVRAGRIEARIVWPDRVRSKLVGLPRGLLSAFDVEFSGQRGSDDGDLRSFADEGLLALWSERVHVRATPRLVSPLTGAPAEWVLQRELVRLSPPELAEAEGLAPRKGGMIGFVAGTTEGLGRQGRLSARDGKVLSTGASLQLEVSP